MLGAMREALAKFPGVTVQDDPSKQEYPMPLYTSEKDDVYVDVCAGTNPVRSLIICGSSAIRSVKALR
mgnify:CR=1 FL=1